MKTYRNEKHGFEIEIPDDWSPAPIPNTSKKDLWQYGCREEAMNFEIGPLYPEPSLDDTEKAFALFTRYRGFSDVKISRIMVAGKEHVCASYFINDWMGRRWNKKYAIVLGRTEFAITATCNDPDWFAKREQDWDTIIQSFRLLAPEKLAVPFTEKENRVLEQRRDFIQENIDKLTTLPRTNIFRKPKRMLTASPAPNNRVLFFSSLICLLLADISFFFPENIAITDVTWLRAMMLLPVFGLYSSGPSVRIHKNLAALIGIFLYLFFWLKTS